MFNEKPLAARVPAVILCGGLGTRLRTVVADRPKVLAPVCGRPFLSFILDQLESEGAQKAVLCTGYLGEQIEETFNSAYRGLKLEYSREDSPLSTGGAVRLALSRLPEELLLVLNGDSYVDADLGEFVAWHLERALDASVLLTRVGNAARYGVVDVDPAGRIRAFREKTCGASSGWINAGIYLMPRRLVEELPAGTNVSLEREVFPLWATMKELGGYRTESQFIDIGTPESLARAQTFFGSMRDSR